MAASASQISEHLSSKIVRNLANYSQDTKVCEYRSGRTESGAKILTVPKSKTHRKVEDRRETFARQFVILNCNGTQAAIAAGYSPKTAPFQASRLLKNSKVKARISALTAATLKKMDYSVERTLEEMARCAFIDPRKLFRGDGSLKPMQELEPEVAACIAGVEQVGKRTKRVKLTDKLRALDMLAKFHKLYAEDRMQSDLGVKVIVLDMPRPDRSAFTNASALPALPGSNGSNGSNGNGSDPHK